VTRNVQRSVCAGFALLWLSAGLAACGGSSSFPRAVQLTLTAPTDGAEVAVRDIVVLGKVDPANAVVTVAGKHPHVVNGAFRQPMVLRRGLNHIKLVARTAGYIPATADVTVRSAGHRGAVTLTASSFGSPGHNAGGQTSPGTSGGAASDFVHRAEAICASNKPRGARGPSKRTAEVLKATFLELAQKLSKLSPPPALAERFQDYLHLLRTEAAQMDQLGADLEQHDRASVQRDVDFDYGLASSVDEVARSLGLVGC
jgi:hypothetical protein